MQASAFIMKTNAWLYLELTKPRLALANIIVAAAAYIFGSPELFDWSGFFFMLAGLFMVIGSACTFNNIYDRGIDARMERTRSRALATGTISKRYAAVFGVILLILGSILLLQTHILALLSSVAGWVSYVISYTPLKHRSGLALYVGALAGATPPVVGYTAATGVLDWYAVALFALLYLWQLPHFMAIARYRYREYAAAGIPLAVSEPIDEDERRRARLIFHASLAVLVAFSAFLILQRWIR